MSSALTSLLNTIKYARTAVETRSTIASSHSLSINTSTSVSSKARKTTVAWVSILYASISTASYGSSKIKKGGMPVPTLSCAFASLLPSALTASTKCDATNSFMYVLIDLLPCHLAVKGHSSLDTSSHCSK
jgi:hypothetical protein